MPKRFFQQPGISQKSEITLDASFRQDGYVRAVTLLFVDRLISRRFDNKAVADILINKLMQQFPDSVPQAAHADSIDKLELMTSTPIKASRTALELTWIFRQLMVDKMCQSPVQYLPAFYQHGDVINPNELRHAGAEVDQTGLLALAKLLDVTIAVHHTEKNEQLPANMNYGNGEVVLHIDEIDGRYNPRVKNKEAFRPLHSISNVNPVLPVDDSNEVDVANQVSSLIDRIDRANKENASWLDNMLAEGSLKQDDLLHLYTANAGMMTWQRTFVESATALNNLLINIAATMISFGITSREELFEQEFGIEQTPSSPTMV